MILIREEHNANAIVDSRTFLQVHRKSWRALKTKNSCNMQYYLLSTIFHSNHAQWSCIISWMTWRSIYNQLRLCIFQTSWQYRWHPVSVLHRKENVTLNFSLSEKFNRRMPSLCITISISICTSMHKYSKYRCIFKCFHSMAAAETIATEKWKIPQFLYALKTCAVVGHVSAGILNNFYKSSVEMNRKDFPLVSKEERQIELEKYKMKLFWR